MLSVGFSSGAASLLSRLGGRKPERRRWACHALDDPAGPNPRVAALTPTTGTAADRTLATRQQYGHNVWIAGSPRRNPTPDGWPSDFGMGHRLPDPRTRPRHSVGVVCCHAPSRIHSLTILTIARAMLAS